MQTSSALSTLAAILSITAEAAATMDSTCKFAADEANYVSLALLYVHDVLRYFETWFPAAAVLAAKLLDEEEKGKAVWWDKFR
jgi:hypothetical protein